MKNEDLKRYFNKIMEGTNGDNSSNSDIIDYSNGMSIQISDIEDEYYKYMDLDSDIDDYVEENDLDRSIDYNKIIEHFKDRVDKDLFMYKEAFLLDFVEYMTAKINKQNENTRRLNMMFNKNGNETTRISIPLEWAKKLGFSTEDTMALVTLKDDKIIIEKD